jgi:hypothetical protein
MEPTEGHQDGCKVWDWHTGVRSLNNALPCTCGFRQRVANAQMEMMKRRRYLYPLKMSDNDFLRVQGIKPEEK